MLTVDLVRARRKGGRILPTYLRGEAAARLEPVATFYAETYAQMIGERRDDVDAVIATLEVPARDRVAAAGLRKVIEDGATFEVQEGAEPEALRREVFMAAARAHRALDVREDFDRAKVLAEVAPKVGLTEEAIDANLYADLRGNELLKSVKPIDPKIAIERYNLGLAQAVLLRASRVTVRSSGDAPAAYRRLFRAARFHQLLHVVRQEAEGYVIELDGPFSIFESVQRYGLRLAMFLPSVLCLTRFHVKADVLWGKERTPLVFEIEDADGLGAGHAHTAAEDGELELFVQAFRRLASLWIVKRNERIFALPGEVVCVPDLAFHNGATGEVVYLETFGFWSRAAVWQRVELLRRRDFPARVLLAVGKQLRVSEEVLDEDAAGELYVYTRTMSPRAVLERLNGEAR